MSNPTEKLASLRDLRYLGLPFGKVVSRVKLSSDDTTQQAFETISNTTTKERGMVVLDAHPGFIDIVAVCAALLQDTQIQTVVGPAAASFFYNPLLQEHLFTKLQHVYELHPVFRKEEFNYTKRKFKNISRLDVPEKKRLNAQYVQRVVEAREQPQTAVLLAPYGGERITERWLRSGALTVLADECPVICTLAAYDLFKLQFTLYSSEVFAFDQSDLTKPRAHAVLAEKYAKLQALSKKNYHLFEEKKRWMGDALASNIVQSISMLAKK